MKICKMKNIIALLLVSLGIILNLIPCYAKFTRNEQGDKYFEEHTVYDLDSDDDYKGFYKNFIIELGAVRVKMYDSLGDEVWRYDVIAPNAIKNRETVKNMGNNQYEIETKYIEEGEHSIILSYTHKIDLTNFKFSNYIPQLTQYVDENGNKIPYVHFDPWIDYDEVWYWADADGTTENAKNLLKDLRNEDWETKYDCYKNPNTGEAMTFTDWFNMRNDSNGCLPSAIFEPLTFYPKSTEQIFCNRLEKAGKYGFQWNNAFVDTITQELANKGGSGSGDGIFGAIAGIFSGIADTITAIIDCFRKDVYYNIGIIKVVGKGSDIDPIKYAGYRDFSITEILPPENVCLTWTETDEYECPWSTEGFWKNFEGENSIGKTLTRDEALDFRARVNQNVINTYKEAGLEPPNIEYNPEDLDGFMEGWGYKKLSDGTYKMSVIKWEGIGKPNGIATDHNKYWTWIPEYEEEWKKITEKMLSNKGLLYNPLRTEKANFTSYRYGADLWMSATINTTSEILIKFHSNLEQLGGTGGIDDEWHLIGKIGSSDYKWKNKSGQVSKIPKTYSKNF